MPSTSKKRKADGELQSSVRKKAAEAPKFGQRTVEVIVGSEDRQSTFDVHEDLLTRHSDFFRAAVNGNWKEGKERCVKLPKQDPEIFEVFYRFVYSGNLFTSKEGDVSEEKPGNDLEWGRLTACWIFGDSMLSSSFKDATLDSIVAKYLGTKQIPLKMHPKIYENSSAGSLARKLTVDIALHEWVPAEFREISKDEPCDEFFGDLLAEMSDRLSSGRGNKIDFKPGTCKYHEHDDCNKPCYKNMF